MPSRVITTGIVLVIMAIMLVFIVGFFLPLSIKSDMNMLCRNTMLEMEVMGGLIEQKKEDLQAKLQSKGFSNILVTGTVYARQGDLLTLRVEADYAYRSLASCFAPSNIVQHMIYDKSSMSRKVAN